MGRAILRIAGHRHVGWIAAAIAFVLSLSFLGAGFLLDDHLHTYILRGNPFPGGPRGSWDLYRFADGADGVREAIDRGSYPWWAERDLKLAFFRPIPSLWRALDYELWGESALLPHVEASIVFGLLVLVAARTYGRWIGGVGAGIAALLFALDDTHGLVVAWIANRYALLAGLFGLLSLFVLLPRSDDGKGGALTAPPPLRSLGSAGLFALALLSGEPAVGFFGYLLAFAWFNAAGKRAGMIAIAPHAAVAAAWAIAYRAMGYGASGSEFYVEPLASPLAFALAVVERLPRLALSQLAVPPAEIWSMLPRTGRVAYAIVALVAVGAIVSVLVKLTRGSTVAKVLGWGALIAAIPACATQPGDRLLLVPGFGAIGVLAMAFERVWRDGPGAGPWAKRAMAVLAPIHFILAPILLPLMAWNFIGTFGSFVRRGAATIPTDEALKDQKLVVVTAPDVLMTYYMFLEPMLAGKPMPRETFLLTSQETGTATLERTGDRTYVLSNPTGQNGGPFQGLYRNGMVSTGDRFETNAMTVTVVETTAEGAPTVISFDFREPLETHRWLVWKGRGFEEIPVLAPGERLDVASTPFFEALK